MIAEATLSDVETADGDASRGSAVVQVTVKDGRKFSILAVTPLRFAAMLQEHGLSHYFGPCIVFLRSIDVGLARQAMEAMASSGDRWFTLYDTPHKTLPQVFATFKAPPA